MISKLLTRILNSLQRFAVPVECPACAHRFTPWADHKFSDWREIMNRFPCPHCGHKFGIGEDASTLEENPPGTYEKPTGSRIEHWDAAGGTLYYLPRSGHWGGLLPITLLWNAFMLPLFYYDFVKGVVFSHHVRAPHLFIDVFAAVGVLLIYCALRQRLATHLLHIGPEEVRLRRSFLLRRSFRLPTREIQSVRRVEAYSSTTGGEDAERVSHTTYAIELRAGLETIRFGSALSPAEQLWLVSEIRAALRAFGATGLGAELPPAAPARRAACTV